MLIAALTAAGAVIGGHYAIPSASYVDVASFLYYSVQLGHHGPQTQQTLMFAAGGAAGGAGLSLVLLIIFAVAGRATRKAQADGTIDELAVQREIMRSRKSGRLQLGISPQGKRVLLPPEEEPRHLLLSGATGTGKSLILNSIAKTIRGRQQPAVVIDTGPAILPYLYRPERDVIVSPFDARGVDWSPFAEMTSEDDAALIARAIVPQGNSGNQEEWNGYARVLVQSLLEGLWLSNDDRKINNGLLVQCIASQDTNLLRSVIPPTSPASGFLQKGNERMLGNALTVASARLMPLAKFSPTAGRHAFSVRRWTQTVCSGTDSWLYLPIRASRTETMSVIASIITSMIIIEIRETEPDFSRRLWLLTDELGELPALSDFSKGLAQGRKYGLCVISAIQAISQLYVIYGQHNAASILSNFASKVFLAQPDNQTAEYASNTIGKRLVRRETTSESHSSNSGGVNGSGGSSQSQSTGEQFAEEHYVRASKLRSLPGRRGYFVAPGHEAPIAIRVPIVTLGDKKLHDGETQKPKALPSPDKKQAPNKTHALKEAAEELALESDDNDSKIPEDGISDLL